MWRISQTFQFEMVISILSVENTQKKAQEDPLNQKLVKFEQNN
jgi:hypothetical protein